MLCTNQHKRCSHSLKTSTTKKSFHLRKRHTLLNLRNRQRRVQALGTRPTAVQNRMTPVQRHTIIQRVLPRLRRLVTGIRNPPITLQQNSRTEVFLAVPPVAGARGGAAGAEDALVEAVELAALVLGLAVLTSVRWRGRAL